ncbi:MAG: hypothetical protein KAI81_08175, partial [Candidatus Marinimicrobia bacterium]|nr:hypothetical protein [Candidatus Neomarinimicrobiota bacterium]
EAMEDPDSLLDNVFNEPNSEETITKTTTEETEEIEENPNNLSEIQLANLLSNAEDEAKISSADSIIEEETIDKSLTEDSTIDETLISDDVSDDVSLETETPIDVPKTEDQAVADEPEIINNTELNTIDTSDSDTETETPVEPVVEKVPEKVPETKESPEKIKEQKAVHVEKLAPIRAYAAKKKNSRVSVEENKLTGEKIVRVETMTMAEIYIKQGLYREALQILEKLKEKATNVSRIEEKIKKVTLLLAQEKK